MEIIGTINRDPSPSKYGSYWFFVKGYDGFFRTKKRSEGILEKGNVVKLEVRTKEKNGKTEYLLVSDPVLAEGAPSAAPTSSAAAATRPAFRDERGPAITWQHSQEMAIEAAKLLLEQGAYKLGAANKPAERYTQIIGLIDDLTVKFYEEVETKAPLEAAKEVRKELAGEADVRTPAPAKTALPAGGPDDDEWTDSEGDDWED